MFSLLMQPFLEFVNAVQFGFCENTPKKSSTGHGILIFFSCKYLVISSNIFLYILEILVNSFWNSPGIAVQ